MAKSLSHPGGNVTGLTNFAEELASKQIDLMRELLPRLARLAALINVTNPLHVPQWRETKAAAAQAAVSLVPFEFRSPDQFEAAFATFSRERADALLVPPDVTFNTHGRRIANLAISARLPTTFFTRLAAENGALMSYGPNQLENYRRAAIYVDKILKGAKPQGLPIEQSQDGQGDRFGDPADAALPRRRGDRVNHWKPCTRFVAVQESAIGTTQTAASPLEMSVHWAEAVMLVPRSK